MNVLKVILAVKHIDDRQKSPNLNFA